MRVFALRSNMYFRSYELNGVQCWCDWYINGGKSNISRTICPIVMNEHSKALSFHPPHKSSVGTVEKHSVDLRWLQLQQSLVSLLVVDSVVEWIFRMCCGSNLSLIFISCIKNYDFPTIGSRVIYISILCCRKNWSIWK